MNNLIVRDSFREDFNDTIYVILLSCDNED